MGRRIKERRGNLSKLCNPDRLPLGGMEMNNSLGMYPYHQQTGSPEGRGGIFVKVE